MRFTVRSLGGKLVISAALMLLLCMLLFSVTSWYFLKSFYEHEARSDASKHLPVIKYAYRTQVLSLEKYLTTEASNPIIVAALTTSKSTKASKELANAEQQYSLMSVSVISLQDRDKVLIGDEDVNLLSYTSLIDQALKGKVVSALQMTKLGIAVPVYATSKNSPAAVVGALLAVLSINDEFAFHLSKFASDRPGYNGLNIALCESNHILGTTVSDIDKLDQRVSESDLCTPGTHTIDGSEHYLAVSNFVHNEKQLEYPPPLMVVDIEPLYSITAHTERAILIMFGLAVFIIALGVTGYALVARTFFVRPIRRLQGRVAALVADNGDTELAASTIDELSMLSRSFSLLSESLSTRENESDVITRQMSDLLAIVSRLGHIMQAKGVALLLYGREMQSPWAVARWSNQQNSNGSIPVGNSSSQYGAVTVHTDPTGDITMTATTKMAAIAVPAKRSDPTSSGKRSAIRVP